MYNAKNLSGDIQWPELSRIFHSSEVIESVFMVWLVSLCVALTFGLSLLVRNGYSIGIGLLFLMSLGYFMTPWLKRLMQVMKVFLSSCKKSWLSHLSRQDKWLLMTFMAYGLGMFLSVYLDGWHTRELDRSSRFILVVPVFLLLLKLPFKRTWLIYGVLLGSIGSFLLALYERFYLGFSRANGGLIAIMFGDIAMMMGMISFVGMLWSYSQKRLVLMATCLLAGFAGMGASFLSGSRGGWVALPLIMLFLLWQGRALLGKKVTSLFVVLMSIGIGSAVAIPQTGVKGRIDQAVTGVQAYIDGTNRTGSVGERFEMWKGSVYLFAQAPVFGVGEYAGMEKKQELADKGIIIPSAAQYSHAHNEYFDALALRGLFGFVLLMAVYLVPLRLFLQKMRQYPDNWNIKAYAMAGALVPMSYMDFALTQSMFSHNIGVMMYVFPIVYFWAAVRWAEREALGQV